ncbi:probable myosin-binding protein 6 isoform X2 [Hordeum vulgare subsp. vulgare]|uniref:probable myosin-binding protein 6 isoform X2 n=1 Tax=Hordeum vulgare subsp. vulgare TaxID=112509 RepID=UPI000296FAA6|nr:probable myosin-binding protein 6 isoform X2 [Hordeum vulgare subsp. vulgare]
MGTRMTVLRRLPVTLSSALLEWILMLLLFIDAVYSFLITRFARLCKLPVPCPFCSRLDHVLGNEEPCFYRELICKTHKSEISSLAFCRLHQKLAGAESMCDGCSSSSLAPRVTPNKNDNTDEPAVDADILDSTQGGDGVLHSPLTRICSCCAQHFEQRSVSLFSQKSGELKPPNSPKICTDYSVSWRLDEPLKTKDIYHQSDHTSHDRYSALQMTSDSEVEVPCADDGRDSHPHEAFDMEKRDFQEDAVFEIPVLPPPEVVKPSEMNVQEEQKVTDSGNASSADPVPNYDPGSVISGSQMEAQDISSRTRASQHDPLIAIEELSLEDATVPQIPVASVDELPKILGETESCQRTSDSIIEPYTSQFTILEQHYAVAVDKNIKEAQEAEIAAISCGAFHQRNTLANDPVTSEPVPKDYHVVASEDTYPKDNFGDIPVSQVSADSETLAEVEDNPKKAEWTGDTGIDGLTAHDPSSSTSKDLVAKDVKEAHIPPVAVRSNGEVSQGLDAIEEHPQTIEMVGERRPPSLSTQISMNEAYNLAIGMRSGFPSPTLTDVILGKGSSASVNGELRLLLSQLSASRGLEATWLDPGPSPRAYGRGDDLIVQNITRRISLERNVSGLESLDGSVVSEMEGESTIDRMRRQIDLDRKSIHLLCRELEEERNAAAIAANQALAMITRLQDEKAAMQMEASHYQRMMEEQAEYDGEALAEANELLAQREDQIQELEAELEKCRTQSGGGGPTEKQDDQLPFEEQNSTAALLEDERAYISETLRKLEKKLQLYSNNNTSTDLSNSDAIEETQESILSAKEGQSSKMDGEADPSTFQEEISSLHKRLKTLEGDRDFLEHSINSLKNGKEGAQFVREIACNLRELRAIAIDNK